VHRRPFLRELDCSAGECSGTILTNASQARNSPVFGLEYGSVYVNLLAMADEDGFVSIINTNRAPPESLADNGPARASAQWTAHHNAVFDLAWANQDAWMYTASGDLTLAMWDTAYANRLARFRGHTGSVKALSLSPAVPQVLASGGRDGLLLLWDGRVAAQPNAFGEAHRPVARMADAHAPPRAAAPRSRGRTPVQGRPSPSVTAVQFLPSGSGHVLASGGVDGVVKLWDVRNTAQAVGVLPSGAAGAGGEAAPSPALEHIVDGYTPRLGVREHAVTWLALHPDGEPLARLNGVPHCWGAWMPCWPPCCSLNPSRLTQFCRPSPLSPLLPQAPSCW
jgi:denticleless